MVVCNIKTPSHHYRHFHIKLRPFNGRVIFIKRIPLHTSVWGEPPGPMVVRSTTDRQVVRSSPTVSGARFRFPFIVSGRVHNTVWLHLVQKRPKQSITFHSSIGISILKIRRPYDRLIFRMGFLCWLHDHCIEHPPHFNDRHSLTMGIPPHPV